MCLNEWYRHEDKANLSLQGMIAVRNKLVDAYKDITNIQV